MKPSEEFDDYWIYAQNTRVDYPEIWRSGKWLIFCRKGEALDATWEKVVEALDAGKLGRSAKVSTMKHKPHESSPDEGVICVYTYSFDDLQDVRRVRQALRELGVIWKIPYKLDMTRRYRSQGDTGISELL
jgi:hypothetical protein